MRRARSLLWLLGVFAARCNGTQPTSADASVDASDAAVDAAMRGESGVVGEDEDAGDTLRVCEFPRIKGGKAFDTDAPWFTELLAEIGQPKGDRLHPEH